MRRFLLLFLMVSFSFFASSNVDRWMYRESRVILGRPRLDQTGKKQVGLDIFLFDKKSLLCSFMQISAYYISYIFEEDVDFDEREWPILEIPIGNFSSKEDLWQFLIFDGNFSLVPKILRPIPSIIESNDKTHLVYELEKGSSFEFLFDDNAFNIKIKLEILPSEIWKFLYSIDGFKPLTFKFINKGFLNKETCENVYKTFFSNYVQFLKGLYK